MSSVLNVHGADAIKMCIDVIVQILIASQLILENVDLHALSLSLRCSKIFVFQS